MRLASFLIFVGWFIRSSFELACIQCTSPVRRLSSSWEHSCLDGTLAPVLCEHPTNRTTTPFQNCLSALYKVTILGNGGVHIHRGCSMIQDVRHECEPPAAYIDMETTLDFFCRRTCSEDGCNRHSVRQISSGACGDFSRKKMFCFISLLIWRLIE